MIGDDAQAIARRFLESLGYVVTPIPEEPGRRRADYLATKPGERLLAEVKGKAEDENYQRTLVETGTASRTRTLGRTNPISRQIREAIIQLRDTPTKDNPFRLLILVVPQDDPDAYAAQYKSTLYGLVDIVIPDAAGAAMARPCFYFTFSEFYDAPDIDGAAVVTSGGSHLLLNGFSSRLAGFRQTTICRVHHDAHALDDPQAMEQTGRAFIADGPLPRHQHGEVLAYIKAKYNLSIAYDVVFEKHSAAVVLPLTSQEDDPADANGYETSN